MPSRETANSRMKKIWNKFKHNRSKQRVIIETPPGTLKKVKQANKSILQKIPRWAWLVGIGGVLYMMLKGG